MGARDRLVRDLRRTLDQVVSTGDPSPAAHPDVLARATKLARRLDDRDLESRLLLGRLHWYRAQALPEGRNDQDLAVALSMFTWCFVAGSDGRDLPGELLPVLAERAASIATDRLEQAMDSADPALVTATVGLWQRILATVPADHPYRAGFMSNLGGALQFRFKLTGDPGDLDAAIDVGSRAVLATPAGHADHAGQLSNLGLAFQARFERTGDIGDLNAAIDALSQAVNTASADDAYRPTYLSNLEDVLRLRSERTGSQADLDEAVRLGRQAVAAVPPDHPDRDFHLYSLANTLQTRFVRTGDLGDLEQAISALEQAMAYVPADHPDHAAGMSYQADLLALRFEHAGDLNDLDRATSIYEQAVAAVPADHPGRAVVLANLANFLRMRFERTGDQNDVDDAIRLGRQAMAAIPADHPDRALALSNLGLTLHLRFTQSGDQSDLDEAVGACRQAVAATPADHPERAERLSNLGMVLQSRFERTNVPADLDEAIDAVSRAVDGLPPGHPRRAIVLSNLGVAFLLRHMGTGAEGDLAGAIEAVSRAVDATTPAHPSRAMVLSNLAAMLLLRVERTRDRADLDRLIEAGRLAVAAAPPDHPDRPRSLYALAAALHTRFRQTGDPDDLDAAIDLGAEAVEVGSAPPSVRVEVARLTVEWAAPSRPGRAADLLEHAIRLLPELTPRYLRRSDRQHAVGAVFGMAADAAAMALADPDSPADQAALRALSLVEAARGVLLSQTLNTRSDLTHLRRRHPELAARFTRLRDLLDEPAATPFLAPSYKGVDPAAEAPDRRRLAAEFAEVLAEIRTRRGFGSFARPPAAQDLLAQATDGPVVVLTVGRHRGDALLVTRSGVTALRLPALTLEAVTGRLDAFHAALRSGPGTRATEQDGMREVLEWLWETVAAPVLHALGHRRAPGPGQDWPRVWWAPGGLLGLLPIHAAGHHTDPAGPGRRTVLDRVVSSYTPTIGALAHARRRAVRAPADGHSLIVAMPETPGASPLPNVSAEAARVAARLPGTMVLGADRAPTKADVLARLPGCTVAHFACHGYSDPADPSRSRLLLHDHHDDPLDVAALSPVDLEHARLAYLSACSTARTGNIRLLDEAIHLTSAFQLAGFPHVIGTLWEINDRFAVEIADAFYAGLKNGASLDTSRSAWSLHQAVRAARDRFPTMPMLWAAHIHAGA